jgi:tripartite-type tricarboxylate transporter receptor subunit TctC
MLLGGDWARPMLAPPGTPPNRVKILREAYEKGSNDPALLAEAKKLRIDVEPSKGEELQKRAGDVLEQPAEVVEQVKKLLVQ